jgi:hypothetical protein
MGDWLTNNIISISAVQAVGSFSSGHQRTFVPCIYTNGVEYVKGQKKLVYANALFYSL